MGAKEFLKAFRRHGVCGGIKEGNYGKLSKQTGNCPTGLCIYCTDRKKVIQECKNPIAEGDLGWIFAITVKVLNS